MKRIIVVGDYNRSDFLLVGKLLHEHFEIFFLEYLNRSEVKSDQYRTWGKAIFWKDFRDATDLLNKIKPEAVVFYFIESFNHVALNVACKALGVKTYHLEHGIRSYSIQESHNRTSADPAGVSLLNRLKQLPGLRSRLKGRLFYQRTASAVPDSMGAFLKQFFKVRSSNNIFETFQLVNDKLRVADQYISFSPRIFEFHRLSDHLPPDYPVEYIGCPAFDYLSEIAANPDAQSILFIDNAFETHGLFGWTPEIKEEFLGTLAEVAKKQQRHLWIKSHPYSPESIYAAVCAKEHVTCINDEQSFQTAVKGSSVIVGFYSTLLMPLMAMPHTTCFSMEMHPSKPETQLSSFLLSTGALTAIGSWPELERAFNDLTGLHQMQQKHKQAFIENWLYKFDGKSGERLKNILLREVF